jgi:hypothetical protein
MRSRATPFLASGLGSDDAMVVGVAADDHGATLEEEHP